MRFLMDTNIAGHYINRRHGVFDKARAEVAHGNPIGIGLPVLAELVAGIEHSRSRDRNMKSLKTALASLRVWPFDSPAAFEYGRIYAELARLGRPVGVVDMMIAAIAMTLGNCTVVSSDSDLLAIPGLKVVNWRA
ncbi:MAG: type II toxin-antitoxin system VapC family toxin [Rhodopirellula sp.]|nr:type II toxin-antitoxin system VapC family toxin [Rhodopirellula sp.]